MTYTHVWLRYVVVGFLLLSFVLTPSAFVRAVEIEVVLDQEKNVGEIASSTSSLSGGGATQTSATSSVIITIPGGEAATTTGEIEESEGVQELLITASNLVTNRRINPTNVVDSTPQFSAIYRRSSGITKAGKYQLQISTTPTFSTNVQDSGYVSFAVPVSPNKRIPQIEYAGSPLASSTPYYWRIKLVDVAGQEGEWSSTASFMLHTKKTSPRVPIWLQINRRSLENKTVENLWNTRASFRLK